MPAYRRRRLGRAAVIFLDSPSFFHGLPQQGPRLAVARSGGYPVSWRCAFETRIRSGARAPRREARISKTRRLIN
jgi:hypothetical protein